MISNASLFVRVDYHEYVCNLNFQELILYSGTGSDELEPKR